MLLIAINVACSILLTAGAPGTHDRSPNHGSTVLLPCREITKISVVNNAGALRRKEPVLQAAPGPLSGFAQRAEGIRGLFPVSKAEVYQELQAEQVLIDALTQRVNQLTPVRHWCL